MAKASEIKAPTRAALFVTYRLYYGFVAVTWGVGTISAEFWFSVVR